MSSANETEFLLKKNKKLPIAKGDGKKGRRRQA
jgi:hypothetical protein